MTATLIIDASITMAWCFDDENTPEIEEILDRLATEAAVVPGMWYLEVTNVLALAEKRKRITAADSSQFLQLLSSMEIQEDHEFSKRAFQHLLPLCRAYSLTSYDAAYLDLAIRRQLPLASLDDDLRSAAVSFGLPVLGK